MSFKFQVSSFKLRGEGLESRVQGQTCAQRTLRLVLYFLLSISISVFSACGRKTPVIPPELAAPEPVGDLALKVEGTGIKLQWGRPQRYVNGSDLDDLGGFAILRATQNAQGNVGVFTQIGTIPVEDRDRFRKAKKFNYTDDQLAAGTLYRYRVQAFTLDGYYSSPSNTVELDWKGGS